MLYVTVCSIQFPEGVSIQEIQDLKHRLEDFAVAGKVIGGIARATEWFFTRQGDGVLLTVLHTNVSKSQAAMHAEPNLLHMAGDVEEGRHYRNTNANGKILLDYLETKFPGAWSYTLG